MKYHFECKHETGEVEDRSQVIPDYHPLTKAEITTLLQTAQHADTMTANSIQIRLCQGIKGYECPRAIEGKVSESESEIDSLFVDFYEYRASKDEADIAHLTEEFYQLMQG